MAILDNNPSFTYINVRNMVVIFEHVAYPINDIYTNQKYLYWDLSTPNDLIESNIKLDQTATRFWVIMNDKGTATIIPQDRIVLSGDKSASFGNGDVSASEFQSLQQQVTQNAEKYNILTTDVDGVKRLIGTETELEDGTILKEISTLKDSSTAYEKEIREIQTTIKDEYKEIRDRITATLIAMTTSLSEFQADFNSFSYDTEITEGETITLTDDLNKITSSYNDISTTLDSLIGVLEINGQTDYITRVNEYKDALNTSMGNLINSSNTAISDGSVTTTEATTIIGMIGTTATKIGDLKALVDEIVSLGLGGTMYEEFSKLNMYKDKIQMEVHDVARQGDTLKDSFAKLEIDSKSISQTVTSHTETINGLTTDMSNVKDKMNKTVKLVEVMYCLSDSSVQPSDSWSTVAPGSVEGKYIWTKTVTTYNDGSITETSPINLTSSSSGTGAPGVGIAKIEVWYYSSTSNVELLGGTWSTIKPENISGRYIWTKNKIYYTDLTDMETAPLCATGIPGSDGVNPKTLRLISSTYAVPFNEDNTPKESNGKVELSVVQQNYTDEIVWSFTPNIDVTGSGNKRSILFSDFASYDAVIATVTAGELTDSATIVKVSDGIDGKPSYTVVLSNESHTFRGGIDSAVAGSTTCDVIAYKGTERVPATIGEITGMPIGMTIPAHLNNGTTASRFTVNVATSMNTPSGTLNVPITVEGVEFNKTFSYTLALKGEDATTLELTADKYIIPFDENGELKDTSVITLNAKTKNLTGEIQWSVSPSTVTLTNITSNTKTINPTVFNNLDTVEVTVSCNSYTDIVTLIKIKDGNGGYAVALSNESHIFIGNETTAEVGATTCKVYGYKGEIRKNCTVGNITGMPRGMSVTIANNNSNEPTITINVDKTMTTKNGTLNIPITVDDIIFNKTFSYSIAFTGKTGVGISKVDVEYILTDSPTTPPSSSDSNWNTEPPTWEMNKFVWSRTKTYYTNNNVVTTSPVMISGDPGEDAKSLKLTSSKYVVVYDKNGNLKDTNDIQLNVVLENFADTITWTTNPSITLTGDNLQKTFSPTVFNNNNQVTISASASTLTDTLTIVKVVDGMDGEPGTDGYNGYTVILSNESHIFLGNEKTAVAGEVSFNVIGYCGGDKVKTDVGTITGAPTGMSVAITNNNTTSTSIKVSVTTALTTKSGTLTIPITVDGKLFTKIFSYSVAIKGENAKTLSLTANRQAILYNADNTPKDTSDIIFKINSKNLTGNVTWSVEPNTVTLTDVDSTSKKINPSSLIDINDIKVTVTSVTDEISDIFTIIKVKDGADGTSLRILGRYETLDALKKAHPTGNRVGDGYMVKDNWYMWDGDNFIDMGRIKGDPGVGISSITEYYLATESSSGVTTSTSGWTTTIQTINETKKYLWLYEVIKYTNDTINTKSPRIVGVYGETGNGIESITNYYLATNYSANVTTSTSGWTTAIQAMTETKKYLWNYEIIKYTNNTSKTITPHIVGVYGDKGATGNAGKDAYTVILSNESHTFPGSTTSALNSSTTIDIIGYKGATQMACTIGTISGLPTGMTTSISNNSSTTAKITVNVTTSMTAKSGTLTIPVTIDGKSFTKKFSYSIALKGSDSQTLDLYADKYVVPFNANNSVKDSSDITLTATPKNLSGTVTWSVSPTSITLSGTGNTRTIAPSSFSSINSAVVTASLGGYTDKVTIVKVKDGATGANGTNGTNGVNGDNGITIVLSNPSHTFMGDETKAKASSTTCNVIAYKGTTQKACTIGTISGTPTGMSTSISNNGTTTAYFTVSVTTSMTTGSGTLNVPVTCDGKTFTLLFSYSLALKGQYGTGVTEIVEEYAMNQDKNTAPTSGWSTTPPTWKEGYYLWTRSKITYKNPTSTSYTTPICDSSWDAIKNIEIGGTNLVRKSDIKINDSTYTTGTFDDDSNTWTLTNTTGGTSTFGYGLKIINKNVIVPYGQTCIISFEIKTPREVKVNWDVNNYANSGSSWAGNDNDNGSLRKGSSKNIPANQWTKCWFSYTNTHSKNTSKVDLYDNSNFGIVMTNETSNITYQIRNVKAELGTIPTAWSPCPLDIGYQIKTVSDIVATHTTDIDSITGRVSSVENTIETIDGKVVGLDERVQTAEQKITKEGITNTVGDYYTTKTQFDNLAVGNRNLLRYSDFSEDVLDKYTIAHGGEGSIQTYLWGVGRPQDEFIKGKKVLKITQYIQTAVNNGRSYCRTSLKEDVVLKPNTEYTMSVYISKSNVCARTFFAIYPVLADGNIGTIVCKSDELTVNDISSTFIKLTKTFTTGTESNTYTVRYYNYYRTDLVSNDTSTVMYIYNPMLSEGNKEVPWTPAPEDQQEIITSTIEHMSTIEQKADSITSTVKNVSKGGANLLLNTRWEGAVPGQGKCPEWSFNSGIHVFGKQGQTGYNKENTIYLGNSSTTAYLMYQRVPLSRIPRNKDMVVSCDINIENNVKGFQIGVDFYNNDTWVQGLNFFDETKCTKADNYSCKFTTPDVEYTHALFFIQHKGSNNGASGYLVIVGNLMLELGTKKTMWQPSYYELVNKSMVTQTANEIKYEFQQGGGFPNLISNGAPTQTNDNAWWYWNATKYTGDNNYTELGFYSNKPSENNCCLGCDWMVVSPGKTYSISFWAYCEPNVVNPFVVAKCCDSNYENVQYPTLCELRLGNPSGTKWYKYKINWTAPSGITRMQLCFHQRNHTVNENYVTRIDQVMVIEGRDIFPTKWYPKFQEVESNTTTINADGVNVRHSNGSRTNLNSSALNFYNSNDTLYAQVANGVYKFWNGSNYIGYLGHAGWTADTSKRNISFAGEYGNTLTLSAKKTSSDTSYQTWLVVSGHEQTISGVNYHQGVILIQPRVSGIMHFYGQGSMGDEFPGMIFASSDNHLAVMGDSYVDIGIQVGSSRYNGIRIDEISGNPYKVINIYGNLDMHGWTISNSGWSNPVSATSAQTYALRTMSDEESYSDPTVKTITDIFPSQTPTQGEIRWTDRETYFTSEVETGVYECYIEIPWWIAQNLENNYHVTITPTNGFYQYYVSERDPYYFIVRSDKDSMGFTFEIVGKLLDNNTTANNASIAGDQYLASDSKEPETANIVTELDTADIITPDTTSDIKEDVDVITKDNIISSHEENISDN